MKRSCFILVLLAVVLQTAFSGIVYIQFQLNRAYIAKNLCVKKEEKNNCCQGSCQLKKQLGDEEKKEKTPAVPQVKLDLQLNLFCQSYTHLHLSPAPFAGKLFSPYSVSPTVGTSRAVFHPPAC